MNVISVRLGALLLAAFPEVLRVAAIPVQEFLFGKVLMDAEIIRSLVYGLAMVLIMRLRPEGLWPAPRHGESR